MASALQVPELPRILQALSVSYDPHTDNQTRQAALKYLDELKLHPEAPHYGYLIASEPSQHASVRQFGLSLLEASVRYRWDEHTDAQAEAIRQWITSLASLVTEKDTSYYRNKIAWLWVQLAKRAWAASWLDMDQMLSALWFTEDASKVLVSRLLVLDILETLSEDICVNDDPVAMLRQDDLGQALEDIMLPQALHSERAESRDTAIQVRATQQGWFQIMCDSLRSLVGAPSSPLHTASYLVKTLQAIRPTVSWISLEALAHTKCPACLMNIMSIGDVQAQTAAIEALYDIINRQYMPHLHTQWMSVVSLALQPDQINQFSQIYAASVVSARDIDDARHTLSKKIAEVLSVLGDAVTRSPLLIESPQLLASFYDLLVAVFKSESLVISLPVLHSICKTLYSKQSLLIQALDHEASTLLGVCSQRLLRYEYLPEGIDPDLVLFLREDFETLPEQHAFLGNYRRHCNSVISIISRARPKEALQHILGETLTLLKEAAELDGSISAKLAGPVLRLEAQLSVVKSCLDGFVRWAASSQTSSDPKQATSEESQTLRNIARDLQQWCHSLMAFTSARPDVMRLAINLLVEVASKVQDIPSDFVQALTIWLLDVRIDDSQHDLPHSEAVKSFYFTLMTQLQKVAIAYPNFLYAIYDDVERRISLLVSQAKQAARTAWGLRAVLSIICQRAFALDEPTRMCRLQQMTDPISSSWQSAIVKTGVSSHSAFLQLIGLDGIHGYLPNAAYDKVQDWSAHALDNIGREIQLKAENALDELPLRMTSSILGATTERLVEGSPAQTVARALWGPLIPNILPNLISMLRLATGFAEPSNWTDLGPEQQRVVQNMFADRFWQAGISNESKDDFNSRVSQSVTTYEGFASTVRGIPRQIREQCYQIIYRLARFDEEFYGLEDLPGPLAEALLSHAHRLSVQHLQRVISSIERLVMKCPPHRRQKFLPPLLSLAFSQLDAKITSEWDRIEQARNAESTEGDELDEEMKTESLVRTTTFSVVSLVVLLLDTGRYEHFVEHPIQDGAHALPAPLPPPTLRVLVLTDATILGPLIVLCTHALQMRDSRCCSTIARVLTSILPTFIPKPDSESSSPPQVLEFICTNVLKAAITSLNEPHFVDCQKDLAALITGILTQYTRFSPTPRTVLLSLPNMSESKVDAALEKLSALSPSDRKARALVLELLDGVRGVSIAEAGKIALPRSGGGSNGASKKAWLAQQQQPRSLAGRQHQGNAGVMMDFEDGRGGSPGLEGISDMLAQAGGA